MLKKRWLNVVCVLSAHHPCLSRDVWRCWRWPGQRLFCIALCGSVLIESGHSPSSGGYAHDAVPSDQTMVERDRYLVKFVGWSHSDNMWLPHAEVHAPATVEKFHLQHPDAPHSSPAPTPTTLCCLQHHGEAMPLQDVVA